MKKFYLFSLMFYWLYFPQKNKPLKLLIQFLENPAEIRELGEFVIDWENKIFYSIEKLMIK